MVVRWRCATGMSCATSALWREYAGADSQMGGCLQHTSRGRHARLPLRDRKMVLPVALPPKKQSNRNQNGLQKCIVPKRFAPYALVLNHGSGSDNRFHLNPSFGFPCRIWLFHGKPSSLLVHGSYVAGTVHAQYGSPLIITSIFVGSRANFKRQTCC